MVHSYHMQEEPAFSSYLTRLPTLRGMPPAATLSPFGPVAPQGAGPLPLLGGGSRAGGACNGRKGKFPLAPHCCARESKPPFPRNTLNRQPQPSLPTQTSSPEDPAVQSAQACLALGSPLRGFAEQRFPPSSTGPHVDRRSLTPFQKRKPPVPSSRKRNPSPSFLCFVPRAIQLRCILGTLEVNAVPLRWLFNFPHNHITAIVHS